MSASHSRILRAIFWRFSSDGTSSPSWMSTTSVSIPRIVRALLDLRRAPLRRAVRRPARSGRCRRWSWRRTSPWRRPRPTAPPPRSPSARRRPDARRRRSRGAWLAARQLGPKSRHESAPLNRSTIVTERGQAQADLFLMRAYVISAPFGQAYQLCIYWRVAPAFPEWLEPMAATLTQERFTGPDWLFERKLDGIRLLAFKQGATRHALLAQPPAAEPHYPTVVDAIAKLPVKDAILDGEATGVWGHWTGRSTYPRVRRAEARRPRRHCAAARRTPRPPRRAAAARAARARAGARRRQAVGARLRRRLGRRDRQAPRRRRTSISRSPHWLKMKCEASQELVIGGFTDPQGGRSGPRRAARRLLRRRDDFVFAGKVGTGFDTKLLLEPARALDTIELAEDAVHEGDRPAAPARALGEAGDRRAGRVHRMDRARQAAPLRGCSASAPTRRRATSWERRGSGQETAAPPSRIPRRCCSRTTGSRRASSPPTTRPSRR